MLFHLKAKTNTVTIMYRHILNYKSLLRHPNARTHSLPVPGSRSCFCLALRLLLLLLGLLLLLRWIPGCSDALVFRKVFILQNNFGGGHAQHGGMFQGRRLQHDDESSNSFRILVS